MRTNLLLGLILAALLAPQFLRADEPAVSRNAAILAALDKPCHLELIEVPLYDVVERIERSHNIDIEIDTEALRGEGIGVSTPFTRTFNGISLRSALNLLLVELDLAWFVDDGVLLITADQVADSVYPTRVYNLSNLQLPADGPARLSDFLRRTVVEPDKHNPNGGPGEIRIATVGGRKMLVVSYPEVVHQQTRDLLGRIAAVIRETDPNAAPGVKIHAAIQTEAKLEAALKRPVHLRFKEAPLSDALEALEDDCHVDIEIDMRALDGGGIGVDRPITRTFKGSSLRSVMNQITADQYLSWTISNEVLLITTYELAAETAYTRVYDVTDLISTSDVARFGGTTTDRFASLTKMLTNGTSPQFHAKEGAPPSIQGRRVDGRDLLLVHHNQHTHQQIQKLLASFASTKRE